MFPDGDAGITNAHRAASVAGDVFAGSGTRTYSGARLRTSEKILIAYFLYVAVLASSRALPTRIVLAWLGAVVVSGLAWAASESSRKWSAILRDWIPLVLILLGYWELQWFASNRVLPWQQTWLAWDRHLLGSGLRAAIEVLGPAIPAVLEAAYLCVYAIPPFCLGALYVLGGRDRAGQFLTTLLLGGFLAYALLPLFPVTSPRLAFPGLDQPHFGSWFRTANVWILDRFDISTGVFPSGHVAIAFSAAFGLMRSLPEYRGLSYLMFLLSAAVWMATIYSRYHYAVDGLASTGIAVIAWRSSEWVEHHV